MANLYRPTYSKTDPDTGEKVISHLRKWYGKYRDADGVLRRVPLCQDKAAAQALLTDLVRKAERQQAGLIDPAADQLARTIDEHIQEFRNHLLANGRSDKHITDTIRLITKFTRSCECRILADLQRASDRIENHIATRRQSGSSHRTVNADLVALRSFCRWLIKKNRIHLDPTTGLARLNVDEDRRRERRPLTEDEARQLIACAFNSLKIIRGLSGRDRAFLYWLAQRTGLRRGELRSLTPQSFDLSEDLPAVHLGAKYSKRRKKDMLPLTNDIAEALGEFLQDRDSQQPLWPGGWWRRAAEMLRVDLKEAGIEPVDAQGRVLDFHGQRMTFITGLARAGVHPATAQKLARHSDINLTLNTYTRFGAGELARAVETLPELGPQSEKMRREQVYPRTRDGMAGSGDAGLQKVNDAWMEIPEHIRQTILTLIAASTDQDRKKSPAVTSDSSND